MYWIMYSDLKIVPLVWQTVRANTLAKAKQFPYETPFKFTRHDRHKKHLKWIFIKLYTLIVEESKSAPK